MEKIYLIKHWRDGYYSRDKNSFGGILFATRFKNKMVVENVILRMDTKLEGPFFIVEGFDNI